MPIFFLSAATEERYPYQVEFNLETTVQGNKVMQDFELELLSMGGDHSHTVKAPPIESDYSSKDCVNLLPSTAVSRFKGIEDEQILCLLKSISRSIALENSPPETLAGLHHRAQSDVITFLKALQSLAYYHARVNVEIESNSQPAKVIFAIDPGSIYLFAALNMISTSHDTCGYPLETITAQDLGIPLNQPALPSLIIDAEDELLSLLEENGYPLATVTKREVLADEANKSITLIFHVDCGPLAFFGSTEIVGNETVLPSFFNRKIDWREGTVYDPEQIERTVNALEASGLFSSINITHGDSISEEGMLPMQIAVHEAKHRSVAFGVGYATDLGPGLSAEWEHRNVRGLGERFSAVANLWWIKQQGFLRYIKPDFCCRRQDLIWKFEIDHEMTKGFREASASLSGTIERQINDSTRISYGGMYTWLRNTHSNNNRAFNLLKIPLQLMWNRANSLLDPTRGMTLHLKTTPTLQTLSPTFAYTTHVVSATGYLPLDADQRFVLAGKATLGSIWGASKHSIPPSERFYAGSDTLLRGYHYWTISPLDEDNKPIGGRSLMVYSFETRWRVNKTFGLIAFYDIGNVYSGPLPHVGGKQLQSAGVGLRYHTPVGPLRIDLAFPFNRRRHLDSAFQLYFGIGQAF